jgi:uncharacterized repeat protein (TIGR03803 family)
MHVATLVARTIKLVALCVVFAASAVLASPQTFETLVNLNGSNGANPAEVSLVQGFAGSLYATTLYGGDLTNCTPYGCGAVVRVTPEGRLTIVHSFELSDGAATTLGKRSRAQTGCWRRPSRDAHL